MNGLEWTAAIVSRDQQWGAVLHIRFRQIRSHPIVHHPYLVFLEYVTTGTLKATSIMGKARNIGPNIEFSRRNPGRRSYRNAYDYQRRQPDSKCATRFGVE